MVVDFNFVLLRELCRQVENADDPITLVELSDQITLLINEKRRRLTLARRNGGTKEHTRSNVPQQKRAA